MCGFPQWRGAIRRARGPRWGRSSADLLDDDDDGRTDCLDADCAAAPACATCAGHPLPSVVPPLGLLGGTAGAGNEEVGRCGGAGADLTCEFSAPADGDCAFDTVGSAFDTVLYAQLGTCGGPVANGNDDFGGPLSSSVSGYLAAGDVPILVVYGDSAGGGLFRLDVP
jgi:hypothetical protein